MPTIGQAVTSLENQFFVDRDAELATFKQWLETDTGPPEILNVTGPGGVGKSALLQAFQRVASQHGRRVVLADARNVRATPEALLRSLGGGGLEDVVKSLNETRPVLMLDTFEQLSDLTRYLQEQFLPRLETDIKLVIAGRYPLGRAGTGQTLWHALIRPLTLTGLSLAEARDYLHRRGLQDTRVVEQVVAATRGHPLALCLAANLVLQLDVRDFESAPEWRLIIRSLVDRLVNGVQDPVLRELLEASAVVRQFDEGTLEAVSGRQGVGQAFDQLCRLSAVQPSDHGLMLHDDVRCILADDLRWRQPERYNELRLRALAYYRGRMAAVEPAESEWLVAERLHLWEHGLIQALLFGEDDPGEVWLEAARPEDHETIERIWLEWLTKNLAVPSPGETEQLDDSVERRFVKNLLRYPSLRAYIARGDDGQAVGFTAALPIYRESADFLAAWPTRGPLVDALWSPDERAALPDTAESSNIYYLLQLATTDWKPEAVQAPLLRNWFGLFAQEGVYLVTTFIPQYKNMLEACGFERVDQARHSLWRPELVADGYVLDLSRIGVEAWIEAIMGGRRPPHGLNQGDVERELLAALLHWNDDAWLAESPLSELPAVAAEKSAATPSDAIRQAIVHTVERARAHARGDDELVYRALELAYLQRRGTRVRAARRLAVSRPTFYRLLKRGVQELAEQLISG
jgi:energy-coupling factor transporter ATP-binding protein EcfA2